MSTKHPDRISIHVSNYLKDTLFMSGPARSLHASLVVHASQNDGLVPDDPKRMAQALGYGATELSRLWPEATSAGFEPASNHPGYLLHLGAAQATASQRLASAKGRREADARWRRSGPDDGK